MPGDQENTTDGTRRTRPSECDALHGSMKVPSKIVAVEKVPSSGQGELATLRDTRYYGYNDMVAAAVNAATSSSIDTSLETSSVSIDSPKSTDSENETRPMHVGRSHAQFQRKKSSSDTQSIKRDRMTDHQQLEKLRLLSSNELERGEYGKPSEIFRPHPIGETTPAIKEQ